jgi:hypothetical protein
VENRNALQNVNVLGEWNILPEVGMDANLPKGRDAKPRV